MSRPIRLIAIDIDGTLLNSKVELSQENRDALRRAHQAGIEIVLGTGRRHDFALPIAQSLGFDLWMMSSNGAVTRSTLGETFHRDLLPKETAIKLAQAMRKYRNYMVLTFDRSRHGRHRLRKPRPALRRDSALDGKERAVYRVCQPDRGMP